MDEGRRLMHTKRTRAFLAYLEFAAGFLPPDAAASQRPRLREPTLVEGEQITQDWLRAELLAMEQLGRAGDVRCGYWKHLERAAGLYAWAADEERLCGHFRECLRRQVELNRGGGCR